MFSNSNAVLGCGEYEERFPKRRVPNSRDLLVSSNHISSKCESRKKLSTQYVEHVNLPHTRTGHGNLDFLPLLREICSCGYKSMHEGSSAYSSQHVTYILNL